MFGGIAGLIIGSFLAVAVQRLPKGEQIISGRSRCDQCRSELALRDLIPVISYVVNRGRCRRCDARIDPVHLALELAACAIGALTFSVLPPMQAGMGALLGWILLTLAALDARHLWLPDLLVLALAVTGMIAVLVLPTPNVADRAIGAVAGFASLFAIAKGYRLLRGHDGMGGGDPKLLGAIGCWTGWSLLPMVLLLAALTGLFAALLQHLRGATVTQQTALPLGSFMAISAFPIWLLQSVLPAGAVLLPLFPF